MIKIKKNIKIIGVLFLAFFFALTLSACDSGNSSPEDDAFNGTIETKSLDQNIATEVGYSTKVPEDFDFITQSDSFMFFSQSNTVEETGIYSILSNEIRAQYYYPGTNLEIDFLGGSNIKEYLDNNGDLNESAVENDFNDIYDFLDYITPLLFGLSYEPFTSNDWDEATSNLDEIESYLDNSGYTINEFKYDESIGEREGIMVDYKMTEEGYTMRSREWIIFDEETEKLISFQYIDFGDEILEDVVDIAAENLKVDDLLQKN